MPTYSIKNTETNEVSEVFAKSYTDFQTFLKENTIYKQAFTRFPGTVDPVRAGVTRPPDSFRDVLKNVKAHHKHNNINDF